MIVGVGAARVRDLFKQAREHAPAIVFIDELDAIGRARGQMAIGGSSEQEQTLNQILTEMDGFSSREGIIVLAATNQPDVLDKALLRPGRFDRRVVVNLPDKTGREAILKVHTRSVPLANDASLGELAAATPGFSGAELKNLVNEAALLAARREQDEVRHKDFLDALEKIVLGPERPLLLSRADKERIAYHEGGHAILGLVVPGADPVNRVTIVPRGQALGVTYQRPDSDRYNYPEAYLRAQDRRHAGRPRGRGDRLRHQDDRGRKRYRASHRPGPPDGHALGHERAARDGAARAPGEPLPERRERLRRREAVQRGDRGSHRCRGAQDHRREPRRGQASPERTPQATRRARRSLAGAGDPQRAGDPRGHGAPARAGPGDRDVARSWCGQQEHAKEWGMTSIDPVVTLSPRDYDAVLFDLDGVLTKTASVHAAAWKRLFDGFLEQRAADTGEAFVAFDIDVAYRRYVDGKPRYDGVAAFLESRGMVRTGARRRRVHPVARSNRQRGVVKSFTLIPYLGQRC